MTDDLTAEQLAAHDAAVKTVSDSVFELVPAFVKLQMSPEQVTEGLIKAAIAVAMTGANLNRFQCADLLDHFAAGMRVESGPDDPRRGKLHVVR